MLKCRFYTHVFCFMLICNLTKLRCIIKVAITVVFKNILLPGAESKFLTYPFKQIKQNFMYSESDKH